MEQVKPDMKPMPWWRWCLAWWGFETYVLTGWRWSYSLVSWAVGGLPPPEEA